MGCCKGWSWGNLSISFIDDILKSGEVAIDEKGMEGDECENKHTKNKNDKANSPVDDHSYNK